MDASALLTSGVVEVTSESIVLGTNTFKPADVQRVRVRTVRRSRILWVLLPVVLAVIVHATRRVLEDGRFDLIRMFDSREISWAGLGALVVVGMIWALEDRVHEPVYVLRLETARAWVTAWATLDQSTAYDVATAIERAMKGDPMRVDLTLPFRQEADLLMFGTDSYPLSQISSVSTGKRRADGMSDGAYTFWGAVLIGVTFLAVVGAVAGYDLAVKQIWVLEYVLIIVMGLLALPFFGSFRTQWIRQMNRYVYIVKVAGPFGARPIYATLDEAEAGAIVAGINSAVAAVKGPA